MEAEFHAAPDAHHEQEIQTLEHVDHYLMVGKESTASDIHLGVNAQPIWRRYGNLEPIWLQAPKLSDADTERLAMDFLNEEQKHLLAERGDVDFAYSTSFGRFRTSVVRHRLGAAGRRVQHLHVGKINVAF